jgi:peroxiredoxin
MFNNLKTMIMRKIFISALMLLSLTRLGMYAQNEKVKPGIVGDKFSDFTLWTYQGQQLSMKDLRGKNVLFIVSRGKYKDDTWCALCHYQYADFANEELTNHIRQKYNLEIVFLLPYNKDSIVSWEKVFPQSLAYLEKSKNPKNPENLKPGEKDWVEYTRIHCAKNFDFTDKKVPLPLPILMDEKQEVSKGLDVLRTEWDGTETLQDVPTVFIIDKEGILRFKYISQNTVDRPTSAYILNFIEKML